MTIRGPAAHDSIGARHTAILLLREQYVQEGGCRNNTGSPDDLPMRDNRLLQLIYLRSIAGRLAERPSAPRLEH